VTLFRFVNSQDNENDWVSVGPGIIVYVAFGLQATSDVFPALVQSVLEFPSQWDAVNQKKISVQEAKGSILIIPQASLLGKLKQKKVQYHGLIDKDAGLQLYKVLVDLFTTVVGKQEADSTKVVAGVYGNRQGLKMDSSGPNTHQFDF